MFHHDLENVQANIVLSLHFHKNSMSHQSAQSQITSPMIALHTKHLQSETTELTYQIERPSGTDDQVENSYLQLKSCVTPIYMYRRQYN